MHLTPTHPRPRINLRELAEAEALMPAAVLATAPLSQIEARRWAINFDAPRLSEETAFIVARETARRRRRPLMQIA